MTLTRDQIRAARVLLHLRVEELAKLAKIGLATLRRFESGQDVGELYLDALRRAVEQQGAILIEGEMLAGRPAGFGVALAPQDSLPADTRARMAASARDAPIDPSAPRRRGRPPRKRLE